MNLPMTWTRWAMVVYSALMAGLGIYGTIKAGEIASLAGGVGIAVLVLVLMFVSRMKPAIGYSLALLVVLGAAGMFGMKYINGVPLRADKRTAIQKTMPESELPKEHRMNPHGIIFFLSVGLALCLLSGHVIGMAGKSQRTAEA